jgi:hypothetical protein
MKYTRIGRMICVTGAITVSSVSSPTGDLRLTGLPFNSTSNVAASIFVQNLGIVSTVTSYQAAIDTALPGTIFIRGYFNGAQVATVSNNVQATSGFYITASYFI